MNGVSDGAHPRGARPQAARSAASSKDRPGSRRSRLEARRTAKTEHYGRFLGLTMLGSLVPGAGLLAAGRRRAGAFFLTLLAVGLIAAGAVLVLIPRSRLAGLGFNRDLLGLLAVALTAAAVIWLFVSIASHRALEPRGLSTAQRFAGALVVIASTSAVVAPLSVGASYAWAQRDFLSAISGGNSLTTPNVDEANPWAGKPRLNILLLGSDAGEGRVGVRPDTQIVASIDTTTGETVLLSLPRNLQKVPFPTDSPLFEHYPYGYRGEGPESDYLLNAVYQRVPELVGAEAFEGSDNPGADANKWAVEGALGVEIDYFVMVNLAGFEQVIDAMGGITVDVNYPIPMGTKVDEVSSECVPSDPEWILPGNDKHLDGKEALWFARARCAPYHPDFPDVSGVDSPIVRGDFNRMERQRCVLGAAARQANPVTLLTKFKAILSAAQDVIETDVPEGMWPAFAELGLEVRDAQITSLAFTDRVISDRTDPDYDRIQTLVQEALHPPAQGDGDNAGTVADSGGAADQTGDDDRASTTETDPASSPEPDEAANIEAVC